MLPKPMDSNKPIYKIIVAGSRSLKGDHNKERIKAGVKAIVEHLAPTCNVVIVNGMAPGPDSFGGEAAEDLGLWQIFMPANWDENGNFAGHLRNGDMGLEGDFLMLFWDGVSNGSRSMLNYALLCGCKVTTYKMLDADMLHVKRLTKGLKREYKPNQS